MKSICFPPSAFCLLPTAYCLLRLWPKVWQQGIPPIQRSPTRLWGVHSRVRCDSAIEIPEESAQPGG
jgi:hypothetical protein